MVVIVIVCPQAISITITISINVTNLTQVALGCNLTVQCIQYNIKLYLQRWLVVTVAVVAY